MSTFTEQVTHLVLPTGKGQKASRTLKYLQGIVIGCAVISQDWVVVCAEQSKYVDVEDYLLVGDKVALGAPKAAYLDKNKASLFKDCVVSFIGDFQAPCPPREELENLIVLGSGKLHKENDAVEAHKLHYVVCDASTSPEEVKEATEGQAKAHIVTHHWLLDSLSHYALQHPKGYLFFPPVVFQTQMSVDF